MRSVRRRLAITGVASAVLAAGLVTVPASTAGAAGTVYQACADKKTGAMRLILKGKKCKPGEKKLRWNVKGPAGIAGPIGPQGPQGPTGAAGARGPAGAFEMVGQDGTVVGTFVGWYSSAYPMVRLASGPVVIWDTTPANPAVTNFGIGEIYYQQPNCAGTGYGVFISSYPFDLGIIPASLPVAGTPVYHLQPGTPQSFTPSSRRDTSGVCVAGGAPISDAYVAVAAGTLPAATKPLYLRPIG